MRLIAIIMLALSVTAQAAEIVGGISPAGDAVSVGVKFGDDGAGGSGIIAREYLAEASSASVKPEPTTLKEKVVRHLENNWGKYLSGAIAIGGYAAVANNNSWWPFEKSGGSAGRDNTQTQTGHRHDRSVSLTLSAGGDMQNVQINIYQDRNSQESQTQSASSPVTTSEAAK